ncbi:hypothetical protein J1614_002093 [Plenodomus biglobosus]|nr:hypothetical protein J1614_002093 [Plenodomus biglobosus]
MSVRSHDHVGGDSGKTLQTDLGACTVCGQQHDTCRPMGGVSSDSEVESVYDGARDNEDVVSTPWRNIPLRRGMDAPQDIDVILAHTPKLSSTTSIS